MKGLPKGPSRLAIEAVMQSATEPMTSEQIAKLSGVELSIARTHIGNCTGKGSARNINKGRGGVGLFVWGPAPKPEPYNSPREALSKIPYTGETATAKRSGSQDAYTLPSLQNGELTERRRPLIIGGHVQPLGVGRTT